MLSTAFRSRLGPTDRKKLIAAIHAQAKTLGMDNDTRKAFQRQLTCIESCADMPIADLKLVWSRLTALAKDAGLAVRQAHRRRPGRDERLPDEPRTTEQLALIEQLYDALGVRPSADMMALARRITGHPWPQNRAEANKLIEGLKAMRARGWRARGAERAGE